MRRRTDCHSGERQAVIDLEIGVFSGDDDVVPLPLGPVCACRTELLFCRGRPGNSLGKCAVQ